jgi:SAM-dependent methyltransferase
MERSIDRRNTVLEMDRWKFYWLTHRYHDIANPISSQGLDVIVEALRPPAGGRVLDIASGKAEVLCRLSERYGVSGVGVDWSPFFCGEATQNIRSRGLADKIVIHQMDGKDFRATDSSFEVTMCLGATWVFGGLRGTLKQLSQWTRPGGAVVVGEPFWTAEPPAEYLESESISRDDYSDHAGNVAAGESLGLDLVFTVASNADDWDRYYSPTWLAAYDYIRDHPDDADNTEIARLTEHARSVYLKHGRNCLNWAIYVFRKPSGHAA